MGERGFTMSENPKNRKSYRTSALLFMISGIIFIILAIIKIYFLPIGIALFIVGVVIWQRSRNAKGKNSGNSSEAN